MIDKICGVLYYLIMVKFISMISKTFLEPWLEHHGYSEKDIEKFILAIEVVQIALLLTLLKGYDK
jgi:hypothetical protein